MKVRKQMKKTKNKTKKKTKRRTKKSKKKTKVELQQRKRSFQNTDLGAQPMENTQNTKQRKIILREKIINLKKTKNTAKQKPLVGFENNSNKSDFLELKAKTENFTDDLQVFQIPKLEDTNIISFENHSLKNAYKMPVHNFNNEKKSFALNFNSNQNLSQCTTTAINLCENNDSSGTDNLKTNIIGVVENENENENENESINININQNLNSNINTNAQINTNNNPFQKETPLKRKNKHGNTGYTQDLFHINNQEFCEKLLDWNIFENDYLALNDIESKFGLKC